MANMQTVGFGFGKQSAQGTGAAFITLGRMMLSSSTPRWTEDQAKDEHIGVNERPTAQKSAPVRVGYAVPVKANWRLYPHLIGDALLLAGFKVTTYTTVVLTITATGGTFTLTVSGQTTTAIAENAAAATVKVDLEVLSTVGVATVTGSVGGPFTITLDSGVTAATFTVDGALLTGSPSAVFSSWTPHSHVFTLADRDELLWGTAYHAIGEGTLGSARYARVVKNARLSKLAINSSIKNGLAVESEGMGILDAVSPGTETVTGEPNAALNAATGTFDLTSSDITEASFGIPQVHNVTINNPLGEDEGQLHTPFLQDLPLLGLGITGQMQGLPWTIAQWKELLYASGVAPSASTLMLPEAALTWSYNSGRNIPTKTVPYSLTIAIAVATVRMEALDISGQGKVKINTTYEMIDGAEGAPITITLVNEKAFY